MKNMMLPPMYSVVQSYHDGGVIQVFGVFTSVEFAQTEIKQLTQLMAPATYSWEIVPIWGVHDGS